MSEKDVILILEDEVALAEVIAAKFADNGVNTVTARSVQQALNYLKEIPNITGIWMDHYLLGQDDGLVLVSKIKSENSNKKDIPIFVVSNTASESKMRAYINLGVSKYIVKADSSLGDVVDEMCYVLEKSTSAQEKTVEPVPTEAFAPEDVEEKDTSVHVENVKNKDSTVSEVENKKENSSTGPKVLVVEDEEVLRSVIVDTFSSVHENYKMLQAQDGLEGFDVAVDKRPDAIILDVEMPRLDGIGFLKKMKKEAPKDYNPYILVLTNSSDIYDTMHALKYGVMDYLIKADNPLNIVVDTVAEKLRERGVV